MKILKKIWKKIFISLLLVGAFFLTGYLSGSVMAKYNIEPRLPRGMLSLALIFLKIGIYSYISILIHELGHLIFGLLTGYKFLSFRLGSLILLKLDGKYRLRRFNLPGTGGQCLLDPPDLKNGTYPYKLYNLGGGILNILACLLSIWALGLVARAFRMDLLLFGLVNLFSGLLNLIPFTSTINNDGKNQVLLRDENARLDFWKSLKINKNLQAGLSLEEMDPYYFSYVDEDVDNSLRDSMLINNINLYLDQGKMDQAQLSIEKLLARKNLIDFYRKELNCDLIFLACLARDKKQVASLSSPSMEKYIQATSGYFLGRKRLAYGLSLLIENNLDQAAENLAEFKKMARNYPYPGEVKMEEKLLARINKIYEEDQTASESY